MRLNIDLTQGKIIRNIFFISDFHLFHNNVLKFDSRPFVDLDEMHTVIQDNWNNTVGKNDIVIYLGDLSFARRDDQKIVTEIVSKLNGTIHFVLGNHDKIDDIKKHGKFESIQDYLEVRIVHMIDKGDGVKRTESTFICMHYPIYSWNKKHHGTYMVHGHCHGNLHHGEDAEFYTNRRVIDVGCMLHDYNPVSYLEVIDKLKGIVS